MMLSTREIKELLRRERIAISRRRGQNFLVDARVQRMMIEAIKIKPTDEILEIGPGLGALTEDLLKQAARVFAVEKDRALARILQKMLSEYTNLQTIHQDILQVDFRKFTKQKIKIVGNLPYYISTPIIGYLLEKQRAGIKEIFITVQDEVGRRLVSTTGSKDYSALSVLVQYFTQPKLLFSIPKRAFYPQPKVNSVFLHLHLLSQPCVKVANQEQFFKIVRACFNQRRKTIVNSLTHQAGSTEKARIQRILTEADVDFQARPEQLSLGRFAGIAAAFYKQGVRL